MISTYSMAIHGGAGTIRQSNMTPDKKKQLQECLLAALTKGKSILENGGQALDASAAAVTVMEDSPLFNAGKGSVFNSAGFIEMDAAIMCGKELKAGAVTCVRKLRNPILAAKAVMECSRHVLLSGDGAEAFANRLGLHFESDPYFRTEHRLKQLKKARQQKQVQLDHAEEKEGRYGTVGAVALDKSGNLAAATSTGGMTNQLPGRVGDTPLIGSGNYANNQTCAVSCTGMGEGFIRAVGAYDVSALVEYKGLTLKEACREVVHRKLPVVNGEGGLIAVDKNGVVCLTFNSEGMYRAWCQEGKEIEIKMYTDE